MIEPKIKDSKVMRIRHSLAHIMAQAVLDLFPEARLGTGPALDNGFYYDFELPRAIEDKDLKEIQKRMKKIVSSGSDFTRHELPIKEAKKLLTESGQTLKTEIVDSIAESGEKKVSFYKTGEKFEDLCEGPHVDNTKDIDTSAFKLDKFSAAYWRADDSRESMQRIYGLAFETKEELDAYLTMREEAKKRDHRKLGKQLDLFTFSDLIGAGLPLFTPKGAFIRHALNDYVWQLRKERGYDRVEIPHITKKDLYEKSGHWAKFEDELFKIESREGHIFAMKPMNCPHHTQIYDRTKWSYRDLPQRYANTTMVYRDEQSGELAGLSRVRSITQDDAHVFCRESQVKEEAFKIWDMIETFYGTFGFTLETHLSTHDPENMDAYMGDVKTWDKAVGEFESWLKEKKRDYVIDVGEAAFYGPKIDFIAKDSIGREWQVATIQVDRSMPESFDLSCVNEDGDKERIVMLHAAIMGSIERFMSVLIEHLGGAFPVWLAPVQVVMLPIADSHLEYCQNMKQDLEALDIRVEILEASQDSLGKRIRKTEMQKVPYMLVVGDKEVEGNSLTVREYGKEEQETQERQVFIEQITMAITKKEM